MDVCEISDDADLCALLWQWHQRRPGFNVNGAAPLTEMLGATWWHFLFQFDGEWRVGVSVNEHRPHGYEIHVAAAEGTHPAQTRDAVRFVGDRLMVDPQCRLASWCPAKHRAAVRLNRLFLTYEITKDVNGEPWMRFGASSPEWWERHGQTKNAATAVRAE